MVLPAQTQVYPPLVSTLIELKEPELDCFPIALDTGGGLVTQDVKDFMANKFCTNFLAGVRPEAGLAHFFRDLRHTAATSHEMSVSWTLPILKPSSEDCQQAMVKIWDDCTVGEKPQAPKIAGGRLLMPSGVFYTLQAADPTPFDSSD
ncbi:hypothetical protein ABW20_dc0109686 [Dactylellina cionopaga]|nr:hypothetical protein ABW20_dc0109686 [Dactylellina cionopaga]